MKGKLFFVAGLAIAGTSHLASAETVEQALAKCSAQKNSLQRLVCYDNVVKDLNQYQGLNKTVTQRRVDEASASAVKPQTQPQVSPQSQQAPSMPETEFGLEHKKEIGDDVDTMTSAIASLRETLRGKYVIGLNNGTQWEQTDSSPLTLEEGQSVTIERGILGAFYLSREDVNRRVKVKRIK